MARPRAKNPPVTAVPPRPAGGWIVAAALLAMMVWLGSDPKPDPDVWWHLKTGQLILQTRAIPRVDPYSYVLDGAPWVTFEWLFQAALALVWAAAGTTGLLLLRGGLLGAVFLLLLRLAGGDFWAGIVAALTALALRDYFRMRPQLFDYLFFAVFLGALDATRGRAKRALWLLLPALQVLWVNLHGGAALLGVGLVGLKGLSGWLKPPEGEDTRQAVFFSWAALGAACLAAMLVSPHGAAIFTHAAATLSFSGKELIREWAPTDMASKEGALLVASAAAIAASVFVEPFLALTALATGVMGVRHLRDVAFAALAALPLAARALRRLRPLPRNAKASLCAALAMALASAAFVRWDASYSEPLGAGLEDRMDAAIRYLDDNAVAGRMFNSYALGGYLIWKAWPKRKVFVDSRNVEYGADFIRDAVSWGRPDAWERLDGRWKFDYAVLENAGRYEAALFDASPDWALVFWDDDSLVYLRRTPANADLIRRDSYRLLQPNRLDTDYLRDKVKDRRAADALLSELERAMKASARNANAAQARAAVLASLGRRAEASAALEDALARFPRKPGPYMALGWFYEKEGRLADAEGVYQRGVEVARWNKDKTTQAFLENNLGSVEFRLGRRERARALFLACLDKVPGHPQARENLRRLDKTP